MAGGKLLPLRPRPLRPRRPRLLRHRPRRPAPAGPEPGEEDRRRCSNGREERGRQSRGGPGGRSSPRCAAPPPGPAPPSPTRCSARARLEAAQAAARAVPAKIPLRQHNPRQVRLETETKLITHAIRMSACNAETILARALHGHYARAGDEACALIREALTTSGDIPPRPDPARTARPAHRAPPHPRPRRALRPAQRHPNPLPRHHAHPALRSQRTPRHCMNDLPMRSPEHGLSARVTELPARGGFGLELGLRCLQSSSRRSR